MRRMLAIALLVFAVGFTAGQLQTSRAAGTPYQSMGCSTQDTAHGRVNRLQGYETWYEIGWCYQYYLDAVWLINGNMQYMGQPGWQFYAYGFLQYAQEGMCGTHNVSQVWTNEFEYTSDYP